MNNGILFGLFELVRHVTVLGQTSGEAEVTNLYSRIVIHQNIRWLQVSVNNPCRVEEFQRTQDVVKQTDYMLLAEIWFHFNQRFQISVRLLQNQKNVGQVA